MVISQSMRKWGDIKPAMLRRALIHNILLNTVLSRLQNVTGDLQGIFVIISRSLGAIIILLETFKGDRS